MPVTKLDKRSDNSLLSAWGPGVAPIGVDSDSPYDVKYNPDGTIRTLASQTWVLERISEVSGGGTTGSFLVSGGQVVWESGLTYTISAATYYIEGVLYDSPQTEVTLSAADPSNPRIDLFVVTTSETAVVVAGTPAADPSEPSFDPGTQLRLSIALVNAGATEPASVDDEIVYTENAGSGGSPAEWNWSTSGTGFNTNSTTLARTGTKSIEGTNVAAAAYAQGQKGAGTIVPTDYDILVLHIRSKASWNSARGLHVTLRNAGTQVGLVIPIRNTGTYNFVSATTTTFQQIAIPITDFAIPGGSVVNQVRITDFGGAIGFYIDDIRFIVNGTVAPPDDGLTLAEADARYLQRANNLSDVASATTARTNVAAAPNTPSYVTLATNSELTSERVLTAGTGITLTDAGAGSTITVAASAAQQALANPQYVTMVATSDLANERVLTGTANRVTVSDGGAGAAVTLSSPQDTHTTATPQFLRMGLGQVADSGAALKTTGQVVSDEFNAGNSGAALTIDWNNGNCQRLVLTDNCTFTLNNPKEGGRYLLIISQDGTGSRTATWPAAVKWPAATAPTLTTAASSIDIVTLVYTDAGAGNIYVAAANMDFR